MLGHNHVIRGAEAPLPRRLYHGHLDVNSQSPVFDRISLKYRNGTRTETTYSSANPKVLGRVGFADTQISILPVVTGSAMCVQRFDDSRRYADRITYRISLRSSSLWEPRHPLLKVVWHLRHMRGGRRSLGTPTAPSFLEVNVVLFWLMLFRVSAEASTQDTYFYYIHLHSH